MPSLAVWRAASHDHQFQSGSSQCSCASLHPSYVRRSPVAVQKNHLSEVLMQLYHRATNFGGGQRPAITQQKPPFTTTASHPIRLPKWKSESHRPKETPTTAPFWWPSPWISSDRASAAPAASGAISGHRLASRSIRGRFSGWCKWMDGWMDGWMDVCISLCLPACLAACR